MMIGIAQDKRTVRGMTRRIEGKKSRCLFLRGKQQDLRMNSSQTDRAKRYRLAIRRPVATAMLFLTLVVFGWRSYQYLPVTLMPDISYPSFTVRTEYEGAAPEDVEMLITRPLEELLSIVGGLVEISSISSAGLSEIILEFTWGTDLNLAQQDIRDRLDLFDPPREVTRKPVILRYDPTLDPVMRIAIVSNAPRQSSDESEDHDSLTAIREAAERRLKSDLEAEDGIAQARVKGGRPEEIQVLLDVEQLKSLGISPQYVVSALAQQNINLSGGRLREGDTEYLVRTLNEYSAIDDIANSIIVTPGGVQRRLIDVAAVFLGTRERETAVHINGREAVAVDIFKEGDANTIHVCNKVRDLLGFERPLSIVETFLNRFQAAAQGASSDNEASGQATAAAPVGKRGAFLDRLPQHAELVMISDQSRFIRGAVREVQEAALLGGLLALAVLFLFLREMRSTLIIGAAIPISVVAAFVPMFFRDISLNIMSLGGLALGVGMLVDNSIVVLESVFRCREEGDSIRDAAERGTREVAGAVTASTLTTICVFLPVAFVEGIAGQLFGDLAMTVTFSLSASLLTALYLIPLIVSRSGSVLTSNESVIWLVRAYREGRIQKGQSVCRSFIGMPLAGLRYARAYLREALRDSFGPPLRAIGSIAVPPLYRSTPRALLALLLLPLSAVLCICQLVLGATLTLLGTFLYLSFLLLYFIYRLCRAGLSALLFPPLWLFAASFNGLRSAYAASLRRLLPFSAVFLLLTALATIHAASLAYNLGRELVPPMRQGEFGMRMQIRAGSRLEETEQRARKFEEIIRAMPEVAAVTTEVGRERSSTETERGENTAEFTILLKDPERMAALQDELIERLRQQLLAAADDEVITFTLPTLFSFRSAIETQLFGDSLPELRQFGQAAANAIAAIDSVKDVELSAKPGYPELIVEMDRELLAARGLSPGEVAQRLRTEIQGEVATRFSRGADKVDVRVRAHHQLLRGVDDLRRLAVSDGPTPIPLSDVAELRIEEGPSEIRRVSQRRTVLLSANVEGRDLGAVSRDIDERLRELDLPADMYYLQGGQRRELDTAFASFQFALLLSAFLVYVVMACQFESFLQPALVMCAAPLALIGVAYTLHFTNTNLSVMVFLGGIVLIGVVVNDAIILVDYINQLRARGLKRADAIVEAGRARLRPIIMTTVTSVLGLAPMLTASGEGAEMRRPMALTVVSGLSAATLLTLYVIPMAYHLFSGKERS